jgi:hypothetical protein
LSASNRWVATALKEIPILVLGILIAFWLDAWWGARSAREAASEALQTFGEELSLVDDQLATWISRHDRIGNAAEAILKEIDATPTGLVVSVPDSLLVAVLVAPTFDLPTTSIDSQTLEQALGPELGRAVAAWRGALADAMETERRARLFTDDQLAITLANQMVLPRAEQSIRWLDGTLEEPIAGRSSMPTTGAVPYLLSVRHKFELLASAELEAARTETGSLRALVLERASRH